MTVRTLCMPTEIWTRSHLNWSSDRTPNFAQNKPLYVSRNRHTAVCSCFQRIWIPLLLNLFMIQATRNRLSIFELRTFRSKSRSLRTCLPLFSKRLSYRTKKPENRSLILADDVRYSVRHPVYTTLVAHPAFYPIGIGVVSPTHLHPLSKITKD
jgi:hypothetical protein